MSLDVYISPPRAIHCIHCHQSTPIKTSFGGASFNITHNLGEMADKAGIHDVLWHPEKYAVNSRTIASDLIPIIQRGFTDLVVRPEYYRQFDAKNGWGTYPHFVEFVHEVLECMKDNPDGEVYSSR